MTQMTPEEHYRRMMSALNEHSTFEEQQQQRLYQLANSMAVPSHGGRAWLCTGEPWCSGCVVGMLPVCCVWLWCRGTPCVDGLWDVVSFSVDGVRFRKFVHAGAARIGVGYL